MRIWLRRSVGCVVFACVSVAGCGGSDPVTMFPMSPPLSGSVGTSMHPAIDGFSFPNFPSSAVAAEFDEVDLVAMFGARSCVDGMVDPCVPLAEAAAWARMVNQFRSPGHCEGLVVEALTRFNDGAKPPTVELENTGQVTKAILRSFASQFLEPVRREASAWQDVPVSRIVDEIGASLRDGELDYTLGLYVKEGGHAVLPYAVEVLGESLVRIHVYDSNWPGRDRYVEIDTERGSWVFSFASADPENDPSPWSGGSGSIDLASLASRQAGNCPFCESESVARNSVLVIKSNRSDWSVSTEKGTYSPNNGNKVSGVSVNPVRSSVGGAPIDYVVEIVGSSFDVNLPDPATVYISKSRTVMQIEAEDGLSSPVRVRADSIASSDSGARLTVAYRNLVARVQVSEAEVLFRDDELAIEARSSSDEPYRALVTTEVPSVDVREGSVGSVDLEVRTKVAPGLTQVFRRFADGTEGRVMSRVPMSNNEISAELPQALRAGEVKFKIADRSLRDLANPDYLPDVPRSVSDPTSNDAPSSPLTSTTVGTLKPIGLGTTSTTMPSSKVATTTVKPSKSLLPAVSTTTTSSPKTTSFEGSLTPIIATTTTATPKTTSVVGSLVPILGTTTTTVPSKSSGNLFTTTTTVGSITK